MKHISKSFRLHEVTPKVICDTLGEYSLRYLNRYLIETLQQLRDHFQKPMTINDWYWGGAKEFSGYHPLPCIFDHHKIERIHNPSEPNRGASSAHRTGDGADFTVKGISDDEVKLEIFRHRDNFPHITRMELGIKGWTHIDLLSTFRPYDIYCFYPTDKSKRGFYYVPEMVKEIEKNI